MQTTNYTFLVPETTSHDMQRRPYHLVHLWNPSYGAYVIPSPYMGTVPHPSYGAITAPLPLSPYHTRRQYLAYVPSTHYSLPSPQHYPVTVPIGPRQSSIPRWQRSANIPPRQNRGYIPSRQRRANIPPRQRRNYVSVMQGGPTALSYADRVQPQLSDEPELVIYDPPPQVLEIDDVIQGGGTPAAEHALKSLPSVIVSLDDDGADCVICFDKMCSHDDKDITKLPCDHLFHRHCIVHWLSSNNTCPICRFMLPIDETTHQA
ncbi:E3 ubiquitin-protein ligase RING1-like protein [Carex littledalei]|uniref:E3 ubiquitin-protein ligase RING1-like protein n=1 Tax=Carex littledalei TaxID=544730 RepID=A0A833RUS5_9POAL|nr:E3 ubiquitin-protein ligase RING1-like protein [Carex littledalei]